MELTVRLTTRTEDSHATPVTIILPDSIHEVVRFNEGYRIKQHASLLVSESRLMIWVSALRPYSPGGMLNTFTYTCNRFFKYVSPFYSIIYYYLLKINYNTI